MCGTFNFLKEESLQVLLPCCCCRPHEGEALHKGEKTGRVIVLILVEAEGKSNIAENAPWG